MEGEAEGEEASREQWELEEVVPAASVPAAAWLQQLRLLLLAPSVSWTEAWVGWASREQVWQEQWGQVAWEEQQLPVDRQPWAPASRVSRTP